MLVGRTVGRSVHPWYFWILSSFCINEPAQLSATGLLCIRPCFVSRSISLVKCLLNEYIPDFRLLASPALLWHKRHWRDNLSIIRLRINVDPDTNIVLLQMVSKNVLTDQTTDSYIVTCSTPNIMSLARNKIRLDTRQSSRGRLGRSSNVKTARN